MTHLHTLTKPTFTKPIDLARVYPMQYRLYCIDYNTGVMVERNLILLTENVAAKAIFFRITDLYSQNKKGLVQQKRFLTAADDALTKSNAIQ